MTAHPPPRRRPGVGTGLGASTDLDDLLTGGLLGAVALLGVGGLLLWVAGGLAGLLAHGRWPDASATDALFIATRLPAHPSEPAAAWPASAHDQVPGPFALYAVLIGLVAATFVAGTFGLTAWSRYRAGHAGRERDRSPVWARPAQIRALLVTSQVPGRVVLGRLHRRSRRLVAAEARRSVLVVAPTQAGKTSRIVVPTVLRWTGPMLVTSVKADVLRLTLTERARRGPAYVFDPTGAATTGPLPTSSQPTTTGEAEPDEAIRDAAIKWSPLLGCATYPDAERTAAWLIEAGGDQRGEVATFWESLAAKLLAPLLYAAAGTGGSLRQVGAWLDRRETTEVTEALSSLGDLDALDAWAASCAREERQRDSVYATSEAVLRTFASPSARAATDITRADQAAGRVLDVETLLAEAGTLYLVAPAHEQGRLRPLFEALVQAVLRAAQDQYARTGRPLDPALMVMLDEAAHIAPLRQLATHAATGAGQGIQICSVWQDLAQVEALYGRRAATVVNGHTARVFLAGSADLATLDATSRMIGDHPTRRATVSAGTDGRRSTSEHIADARLAPPEYLRQLPVDTAVVLYGRAPAIRLSTIPWYTDRSLRRLVDPAAAADSDRTAPPSSRTRRFPWPRVAGRGGHPQGPSGPQIAVAPAAASAPTAGSQQRTETDTAAEPGALPDESCPDLASPTIGDPDMLHPDDGLELDLPTALGNLAHRLADPVLPVQAVSLAWRAADLAEAASLQMVHAGNQRDMPAYLTAADAFAAVRTDLDDHIDHPGPHAASDPIQHPPADDWSPGVIEDALAHLARTMIVALSGAARRCGDPELALACSRAALSAADAAEATTRTGAQ